MNLRKLVARIMVLGIVAVTFCASSQPASASTYGGYSYDPCKAAQAAVNYLLWLDDQIEAFAQQHSEYAAVAADEEAAIGDLINAINTKYSHCNLNIAEDE
jgi:hypothetical protein